MWGEDSRYDAAVNDTHPDIHRKQIELLRGLAPHERLRMAMDLTQHTIAAAWEGLCKARPELPERERELLWVRINYGPDLERELRAFLESRGRRAAV